MLSRFHLIRERHGQTDRWTDGLTEFLYQYRASVCWRLTCDKKLVNKFTNTPYVGLLGERPWVTWRNIQWHEARARYHMHANPMLLLACIVNEISKTYIARLVVRLEVNISPLGNAQCPPYFLLGTTEKWRGTSKNFQPARPPLSNCFRRHWLAVMMYCWLVCFLSRPVLLSTVVSYKSCAVLLLLVGQNVCCWHTSFSVFHFFHPVFHFISANPLCKHQHQMENIFHVLFSAFLSCSTVGVCRKCYWSVFIIHCFIAFDYVDGLRMYYCCRETLTDSVRIILLSPCASNLDIVCMYMCI